MENRKISILGCAGKRHSKIYTCYVILLLTILVQMSVSTQISSSKKFKRSLICVGENLGPNASPECKALNERMSGARERPPLSPKNDPSEPELSEFSKALKMMEEVGRRQEEEYRRQRQEESDREYRNRHSNSYDVEIASRDEKYRNKVETWPYIVIGVFFIVGITIAVVCFVTNRQRNSNQPSYTIPAVPPSGYVSPYDTQAQSGFIPNYAPTGYIPANPQSTGGNTNMNSVPVPASVSFQAVPLSEDGVDLRPPTYSQSVIGVSAPPHDEEVEQGFLSNRIPGPK